MMIADAATAISAQVMALITHGTMEADRSMAQWAFCALFVAVLRLVVALAMALLAVSSGPISSAWMRSPMLRATASLSKCFGSSSARLVTTARIFAVSFCTLGLASFTIAALALMVSEAARRRSGLDG